MMTPALTCTTYNYDIINDSGSQVVSGGSLTQLDGSIYWLNFTEETGNYIVRLCDNSTREFRVTQTYDTKFKTEVDARMSIAISIFLVAVTIMFFYMAANQKNKNFQIFYFFVGMLFIVADLYFSARLTEAISPEYTGIIRVLDTMYMIGLSVMIFLLSLLVIYFLFKVFDYFKNYKKIKLERSEEDWFKLR